MTRTGRLAPTARVARLDLRLDRRQLVAWVLCLGGVTAVVADAFERLYPTAASRASLRVLAANPTLRAILGQLSDWRTTGGLVAWREGTVLCVALSLATTFLVVRRTRAEEQHGRAEVLLALPLPRAAPALAALAGAATLDALGGAACALALIGDHQGIGQSVLFGATIGAVALSFGALAAVIAQLAGTSRGANGAAAGVVAAAYLLVALGNLASGTVLWLSPLGWFQEVEVFGHSRAPVLLVPLGCSALAAFAAVRLCAVRDLGRGLLAPRRPHSRAMGRSVRALAWRLEQRTVATTIGAATAYGVVAGSLVARFPSLLKASPAFERVIERLGGSRSLVDAFTTYMVEIGAIALAAWGTSLVLRAHTEEQHGRVALLLASGAARTDVLDGFVATALCAASLGTLLWSFGIGLGRAIGEPHAALLSLASLHALGGSLTAGLVALPAVLALCALGALCTGVTARFAILAWAGVGWCGAVAILGTYLGLPGWVLGVSPFRHVPAIPLRGTWWVAILALLAIAAAMVALGRAGFARRDLGAA